MKYKGYNIGKLSRSVYEGGRDGYWWNVNKDGKNRLFGTLKLAKEWINEQVAKQIYVIVGYKPADEANGQQDSHIFGFCKTKKEADHQLNILRDKYIPQRLDYTTVDMIGWRFNNDIEAYIANEKCNKKVAKIIRADWEKWGGHWKRLRYSNFSVEEIKELTK